jgi:transketolase
VNKDLRRRIVEMIYRAGEGHIPSAFSIVDIVEVLYGRVLGAEDRFILSKGHGCAALYATLERNGVLRKEHLDSYGTFDGILGGHPDRTKAPVECSTGSLGHGLPMGVGLALGLRIKKESGRVYVLVGDGEAHEGTTWEAARAAPHLGLALTAIVDNNLSAEQLIAHSNLAEQFKAFGWYVSEIDGHDSDAIEGAAQACPPRPHAIIANTTKGKGVSFLEGHGKWHHRIPNEQEYADIMKELS